MEISSQYTNSLNAIFATESIDESSYTRRAASGGSDSGDTVSISDEARTLFSQMMAKYSDSEGGVAVSTEAGDGAQSGASSLGQGGTTSNASVQAEQGGQGEAGNAGGESGGSGGSGGAGGSGDTSSIEEQREKLEAEIATLTTQLGSLQPDDPRASSINSKIAALQAELQALLSQS